MGERQGQGLCLKKLEGTSRQALKCEAAGGAGLGLEETEKALLELMMGDFGHPTGGLSCSRRRVHVDRNTLSGHTEGVDAVRAYRGH